MAKPAPASTLVFGKSQLRHPDVDPVHLPLERPHALTLEPPVR